MDPQFLEFLQEQWKLNYTLIAKLIDEKVCDNLKEQNRLLICMDRSKHPKMLCEFGAWNLKKQVHFGFVDVSTLFFSMFILLCV